METVVLKLDPANPDSDMIQHAAAVLRAGGLVAFPTETVYGLGANALDAAAVARIYTAKGRPATNPVIVHVADATEVLNVAQVWQETAIRLAERFWPGPLTIVVPKRDTVPDIVTATGPTVAVRCPNSEIARALIRAAGTPLAAPSANRSSELSPTRAEHVLKSLNGKIDVLLDGGPCPGGIESTVVDVTQEIPRILRPGLITAKMIEAVCGAVAIGGAQHAIARAPGQMAKHYSPRTPVVLTEDAERTHRELRDAGLRVMTVASQSQYPFRAISTDPTEYASDIYAILHELDDGDYDRIVIALPPDTPEWAAIRDRLTRAATV